MMLAILIGLSAAGLTALARTIAQDYGKPELLLEKPLSCDLCMSFWGSFISVVVWAFENHLNSGEAYTALLGGIGAALIFTKAANRLGA